MCDIWKSNDKGIKLSPDILNKALGDLIRLKTREVVFSGGEALLYPTIFQFCEQLKEYRIRVTILSTGLLLERFAQDIAKYADEVIISLDGPPETHDRIRRIPNGFAKIEQGVIAIKKMNPLFALRARSVIQRENFRVVVNTVDTAKSLDLDSISFLAADVTTDAFNHENFESKDSVVIGKDDLPELEKTIEELINVRSDYFRNKFVVESPKKMRRLVQYYKALAGLADFPRVRCNAPWVSSVVEATGDVRPCFFHKKMGSIKEHNFFEVLNSEQMIEFRRGLNVKKNEICQKCVCSLNYSLF